MYCVKCGKILPKNIEFCDRCNAKILEQRHVQVVDLIDGDFYNLTIPSKMTKKDIYIYLYNYFSGIYRCRLSNFEVLFYNNDIVDRNIMKDDLTEVEIFDDMIFGVKHDEVEKIDDSFVCLYGCPASSKIIISNRKRKTEL